MKWLVVKPLTNDATSTKLTLAFFNIEMSKKIINYGGKVMYFSVAQMLNIKCIFYPLRSNDCVERMCLI